MISVAINVYIDMCTIRINETVNGGIYISLLA